MATYTYLASDILSGVVLGELPLRDVQAERRLCGAGAFTGSFSLPAAPAGVRDVLNSAEPWRTVLSMFRDNTIVWSGPITSRRYASSSGRVQVGAIESWGYYAKRFIDLTLTYSNWDQLEIAAHLVAWAEGYGTYRSNPAGRGPGIGTSVTLPPATCNVTRDRTYNGYELTPVGQAVEDLASCEGGFEFYIKAGQDSNGTLTRSLVLGSPRLGIRASVDLIDDAGFVIGQSRSPWIFDYPGNINRYEWPEDGSEMSTEAFATGTGEGTSLLRVSAKSARTGLPLLQAKEAFSDVSEIKTLQDHAAANVDADEDPKTIPLVAVNGDADPEIGSYEVGDDVWLRIRDVRHPALDAAYRLVGFAIVPASESSGEQVALALGPQVA